MFKLFLRTFVLLTALSSCDGAHAGNKGFKAAKPTEPEETSMPLQSLTLVPVDVPLAEFPVVELQKQSPLMGMPRDLWLMVLRFSGPEAVVASSGACKLLRRHILNEMMQVQHAWGNGIRTPEMLRRHLFHPLLALRLHEEVSRITPLRTIQYAEPLPDAEVPQELPENNPLVEDYVKRMGQSQYLTGLLCGLTLPLDPGKDFRKVCIMADILRSRPDVLSDLCDVAARSQETFDKISTLKQFRRIMKSPQAVRRWQISLMAAKLLALNDYKEIDVKDILGRFSSMLVDDDFDDELEEYLLETPDQPLWACYTDDEDALHEYELTLGGVNEGLSGLECLQNAAVFGEYLQCLFPNNKGYDMQSIWQCAADYSEYKGDIRGQAACLKNIMARAELSKPSRIIEAQEAIVEEGRITAILEKDEQVWSQYEHILGMMEKTLENLGPVSAERSFMLLKMSESILFYNDIKRFDQVASYLDEVFGRFGPDAGDIEVDLVDPDGEHASHEIMRGEVISAKFCLAIYQGRFDEVLLLLNERRYNLMGANPFTNVRSLMALRTQMRNPNLPEEIVKKIGNIMSKQSKMLWMISLLSRSDIAKNKGFMTILSVLLDEEFVKKFFKGHPIVRASLLKKFSKPHQLNPSDDPTDKGKEEAE
jgi:hypothetical protein